MRVHRSILFVNLFRTTREEMPSHLGAGIFLKETGFGCNCQRLGRLRRLTLITVSERIFRAGAKEITFHLSEALSHMERFLAVIDW